MPWILMTAANRLWCLSSLEGCRKVQATAFGWRQQKTDWQKTDWHILSCCKKLTGIFLVAEIVFPYGFYQ